MSNARIDRRLILFGLTLAGVGWALWSAGGVLLPFIIGLSVAYFVAPLVARIDRFLRSLLGRWPWSLPAVRPAAILIVYAMLGGAVAGAVLLAAPPLIDQLSHLVERMPELGARAEERARELVALYEDKIPPRAAEYIEGALTEERLEAAGMRLLGLVQRGLVATMAAASNTLGFVLASFVIPFWLFYILQDTGRVLTGFLQLFPPSLRPDVEAIRIIADRVLAGYIRGQAIVALSLAAMFSAALTLLGVPYGLLLGALAGALGIVPYVGALVGAVPPLIVGALEGGGLGIKVLVAILVVQQVDNLVISPRVQGDSVRLNPGVIMVVVVVGQALMGPIGFLVAVPLAAIVRDVVHYLYLRLADEPPTAASALETVGYGAAATDAVRGDGAARVNAA